MIPRRELCYNRDRGKEGILSRGREIPVFSDPRARSQSPGASASQPRLASDLPSLDFPRMGLLRVGMGLVAFSPSVALTIMVVGRRAELMIIGVSSAVMWLLAMLLISVVWKVFPGLKTNWLWVAVFGAGTQVLHPHQWDRASPLHMSPAFNVPW